MPSILLIDDDPSFREMLETLFQQFGFRILSAESGEPGLRLARAHHPDIVLTDIRMPGVEGLAFLQELRATPGHEATPILMITGEAGLPDMRRSMDLGADDYIAKPCRPEQLLATVENHLRRTAQRREAVRAELRSQRHHLGETLPPPLVDPLHEIMGCASVLELDSVVLPAGEVREFANSIIKGAETLNRRLENFYMLFRLEAESVDSHPPESLTVDEFLRPTARAVAGRHHRTDTLAFDLVSFEAVISRDRLTKIITELIENACRFSPRSEKIDITISTTETDFTFRILDRGQGIPEAKLQAANRAACLGLTVVRRLCESLGGSSNFAQRTGGGTEVSITLPLRPAA